MPEVTPAPLAGTLAAEVDPNKPPQISFALPDGSTVYVPVPLAVETWWWILDNCRVELDPNTPLSSRKASVQMLRAIVLHGKRILSVATGIREVDLDAVPDLEPTILKLMAQVRGEWQDAAPFSTRNLNLALNLYRREQVLAGAAPSDSGSPQSQSVVNAVEATGSEPAK